MMISEIFKKYEKENADDDDLITVEKGEDLNLGKKDDKKKKGCC